MHRFRNLSLVAIGPIDPQLLAIAIIQPEVRAALARIDRDKLLADRISYVLT
jgi:hypothetical protein